ncbi:MAG TPA: DNA polymerase III subunit epsilon, partial [Agriterribacter sp.]|nr:DNA polymerase III subunit epsilon [Agriterribacter sp.]
YEALPTFAVLGEGVEAGQQSCVLIEKGKFYGMGYIPLEMKIKHVGKLKKILTPYPDNDFIRNMIYRYAETNPQQMVN